MTRPVQNLKKTIPFADQTEIVWPYFKDHTGHTMIWYKGKLTRIFPKDKAALIVDAFDKDHDLFFILADWIRENEGDEEAAERFALGNFHSGDYRAAMYSLHVENICELQWVTDSLGFKLWLDSNRELESFLKFAQHLFNYIDRQIYEVWLNPSLFEVDFGKPRRFLLHRTRTYCSRQGWVTLCQEKIKVCRAFERLTDAREWARMRDNPSLYIVEFPSNPCAEILLD